MNNYLYAVLCHFVTLCIANYGCYGQDFVSIWELLSIKKTDKPDGTTDPPITGTVRISWSETTREHRIHAFGHDNIETFRDKRRRIPFLAGDLVKMVVLDTGNVWLCQFPSMKWARLFYNAAYLGDLTNDDAAVFRINTVTEETPRERETFSDVGLYLKDYPLSRDRKMFILKPLSSRNQPIIMIFLSGSFSVAKTGNQLRFTFEDAENRSCTMHIDDSGDGYIETVYNEISSYARRT